jgi:hypothetical protein
MGRHFLLAVILLFICVPLILAQSESSDIKKTVEDTIEIEKQIQQKQDDWATERAQLEARYQNAKANIAYLNQQKSIMDKEAEKLSDRIAEMDRRLMEVNRLRESLQDTLNSILFRLENWVDGDLPFLKDERNIRIQSLKDELAQPEITSAEKFRRLLEGLQVEAGYGITVEVHQDKIDVSGDTLFVDILRLGRISVFWRTPDGDTVGEFDRATGKWIVLPGKYNRVIGEAMEMAARMRPVELIALPLGRIVP